MSKKFVSIALSVLTVGALMGPVAYGQTTTADLQALIASLTAQIAALQAQLNAQTGGTVGVSCSFTRDLTLGATGDDVKCLQQWLNGKGYAVSASGAGSPGNESTYFGAKTKVAVAKMQAASGITPSVGYFGPKTRAFVVAQSGGGSTGGGVVIPPGTGMAVSLALDNPVGTTVLKGSTNVPMLKFVLSGSGTVSSIMLTRTGPGAAGDFGSSGMYLVDETGARLTTGRTVNTTSQKATFTGLNLTVSGTKTVTLMGSFATSSTAANRNAFEINAASDITGSATVSGVFPVRGNEFTVGGSTIATATIATSTVPSNPKVGEIQAKIGSFKITNNASADDLLVNRVTLRYAGSVGRANMSNFTVKYAGSQAGTGTAINSKDLTVLTFSPPFLIERGQNRIFEFFADIAPGVRAGSSETIKFYVEDQNDVMAVSKLYGHGATITNNWTVDDSLSIDGGQITITFNGPTQQDIPTNGSDVTLADYTFAAANNVEIKNFRFTMTTTGPMAGATNEKLSDFKVVDAATGAVVAGPYGSDITTTTSGIVLNDTWTIASGQSRRLKVTADIGSASGLGNDTVRADFIAFNGTDIKNVDSNTNVATTDIVPNGITGNAHTIKAPDLEITLTGTPSSRTLTAGSSNVDLVGLNFRAVADNVQIKTITVRASGASLSAQNLIDSLGSLRLMVAGTQIGQSKSLTGSSLPLSAEFSNLNYTINKGESKVITVNAIQLSNTASSTTYVVGLNDFSADVVAVDSQGNSLTLSGSANPTNGTGSVVLTLGTPTLTITRVGVGSDDTDSLHILPGNSRVLTRLEFLATNGDVTVKKIQLGVSSAATNVTAANLGDDVTQVSLRQCSVVNCDTKADISGLTSLTIETSGNNAGTVKAESATGFFTIPRGQARYFTIEGNVADVQVASAEGADSGQDIYASLRLSNFEAQSGNTTITTYTTSTGGTSLGVTGLQKELLRGQPKITVAAPQGVLSAGLTEVLRMTVDAEKNQIALKAFGINMALVDVTINSAFTASNVTVARTTDPATNLLGSVSGATIAAGSSGDLYLIFASPRLITPGAPETYIISVTPDLVGASVNSPKIVTKLDRNESSISNSVTAGAFLGNAGLLNYVNNTKVWVWSDLSDDSTGVETNDDWSNAYLIRPFPTQSYAIGTS